MIKEALEKDVIFEQSISRDDWASHSWIWGSQFPREEIASAKTQDRSMFWLSKEQQKGHCS